MKTILVAAVIGLVAATTGAGARDLAREFREGYNPEGKRFEDARSGGAETVGKTFEQILGLDLEGK